MSKAMIVRGADEQILPYGTVLTTHAFNYGTGRLDAIYGKGDVLALTQPLWPSLRSMIMRYRNELETFVFVGHGEQNKGIVINDSPTQSLMTPGWLNLPGGPLHVSYVYLYACYQGANPLRQNWINNLGCMPKYFHGYESAKIALTLDPAYVRFFDAISMARTLGVEREYHA
jgi:hypothetical protein